MKKAYEIIKDLMKYRNITINELANLTKINLSTLKGYIYSGSPIPIESLKKIAKALNTNVSYLIGETEIININDKRVVYEFCKKQLDDFILNKL